ncbi:ABC transporter ATP-binding protein [Saccharospirillum impatiens]|uniref:ABC transporter ATP-binding protein n=1 Tax=Saccharospirillum impatiens TaxID=169438 RepID=UPI003CCBA608
MNSLLKIDNLACQYGSVPVLKNIGLQVLEGEICCLLGPSGCGKTTLLQAIAGFTPLVTGQIELDAQIIAEPGSGMAPEARGIGMVFQDYALFPHLTVRQNIGFGLKSVDRTERQVRIREALDLVKMEALADRYPHELSGGQQQRVALARALAPKPRLLLMDEPFSNLDTELRRSLSREVRRILKTAGITAIMVTHDRDEAFVVSDRLGVMDQGRLLQWGTPAQVYHQPATPLVASFVGDGNWIEGRVLDSQTLATELGTVHQPGHLWTAGKSLDIFVRPHEVTVTDAFDAVQVETLSGEFLGTQTLYRFRLHSGRELEAQFGSQAVFQPGSTLGLALTSANLVAFPASGDYDQTDWYGPVTPLATQAQSATLLSATAR